MSDDCNLRSGRQGPWQRAGNVYAQLAGGGRNVRGSGNPFSVAPSPSFPESPPPPQQGFVKPHRGGLVLALGIMSWMVTCPVLSVIAWWMGMTDLREIREGRMDPSGGGLTQAGMVLGMIYTLLWMIVFAVGLFLLMLFAAG